MLNNVIGICKFCLHFSHNISTSFVIIFYTILDRFQVFLALENVLIFYFHLIFISADMVNVLIYQSAFSEISRTRCLFLFLQIGHFDFSLVGFHILRYCTIEWQNQNQKQVFIFLIRPYFLVRRFYWCVVLDAYSSFQKFISICSVL